MTMKLLPLQRRGILKGIAATALAAPLTQMFRMRGSRAATAGAMPKVVFFYTPCGVQLPMWHPTDTGRTFTLPRLSAPLMPYQSDCIFMDGVSMYPLTDHGGGSQQMLAGDNQDVMTMDLQLGDFLAKQPNALPFSSIQLGVQSRISKGPTHPHFTRVNLAQEVYAEDNPLAAFSRIFGMGTSMPTANTAALAQLAAQQKSILDAATADLTTLQKTLPGSEAMKIDAYASSLRDLEHQLTTPGSVLPCDTTMFNPTKFTVPMVGNPNQAAYNQTANRVVVADLQMEIARLSLACGRTQVVTLLYDHTNAHNPVLDLGIFGVHDSSHYFAPPGQLAGMATPADMDAKLTAWENYREWYAQKLAQFVGMLKNTPDVAGGSLLDNTILFHCSELGDAAPHKADRVPFVFIGGKNLGFQLGQAINFTGKVPAFNGGAHPGIANLAHSSLLTIIAKKMGLPMTSPLFGFSGPQALDPMSLGIV
jgi:hypothetical protein